MTYSESSSLPTSYRSFLVDVVRAQGHPLQPVENALTYVVKGFASESDVLTFVKDTFGLAKIGFKRYLLNPGDRVAWRAPGTTVSEDRLLLNANSKGYPNRTAALKAHVLPNPPLALEDLGTSALLYAPADNGRAGPVMVEGHKEYEVEKIVDESSTYRGEEGGESLHYRIRWKGWSSQSDSWIPAKDAENLEALDLWLDV
ncbi:hypothetical protein BKA70DRAFT_1441116 [Coprinopsis sp. MPI-PUGE-AT-0042]|nr:hypothetical protein BKA70DRAFT_1441116 [Coprinopsis sp. MPI-PUGE-AT-0042]